MRGAGNHQRFGRIDFAPARADDRANLRTLSLTKIGAVCAILGWLGIFVAVTGGWLGLLSPASSVFEAVTFPGFVGFFVFMASMGVALLRKPAAT